MIKNCLHCGKPMQPLRSTRKYCSDNCKQLSFYKRSGLQLSGISDNNDTVLILKETINDYAIPVNEKITEGITGKTFPATGEQYNLPLNDKPAFTVNDTATVKRQQEEPAYTWMYSKMVEQIIEYADNSNELPLFQCPAKYWGSYTLSGVKWVSLRLRCLLESLIRLSNFRHIHYTDLAAVKEAFGALVASRPFKCLPSNYPYTGLIKDLQQKIASLAKQHKGKRPILFRLAFNRKAELIAKRHILAGFVPPLKFSELDFTE